MIASEDSKCSLALGTVQFGLDYGITNPKGRPPTDVVTNILSAAANGGINMLDTAAGYGDSEKLLGQLSEHCNGFSVVTKTPGWNGRPPNECGQEVVSTFEASLRHLRRDRLWGLMVHHAQDLKSGQGENIWRVVQDIKASGKVGNVGISFYADDPIDELAAEFKPDFVQLPMNVLDQRIMMDGRLGGLHSAGIEIHLRSVFLQGILLSSIRQLPDYLRNLRQPLEAFITLCSQAKLSQLEGALSFVCSAKEISRVVVGVTSAAELTAICGAFDSLGQTSIDWRPLHCSDPALIDPRHWRSS